MSTQFKSACMVAAALSDEHNPLMDLSLKRLIEWSMAHGGTTYRVPTLDEILAGWEAAEAVSNNGKLSRLWLSKVRGETVKPTDILSAFDNTVPALRPEILVRARRTAMMLLLTPEELEEAVSHYLPQAVK